MEREFWKKENIQFAAADHVTYNKDMSMTADSQKNPSNSEKSEHLFPCLRACISPSINTCIYAFGQVFMFIHVKPRNFFGTEIFNSSGI
jgi:hypothetical protein